MRVGLRRRDELDRPSISAFSRNIPSGHEIFGFSYRNNSFRLVGGFRGASEPRPWASVQA